jgi:tRNA(Ile)-lysidine synthase
MAHFDDSRRLWRPLLNTSRTDIESYAKKHQLKWIEDESNQNIDFDRNFIRSKVLPILKNRFNHIIKVISRSSSHLAEAQYLLDELAQIDLISYLKSDNYKHKLQVKTLDKLSNSRAKNLLRYWLEINNQIMPSKDLLDELLRQVLTAKKDATIKIQLSKDFEIRRYKDEIYIVKKNLKGQKNYEIIWKGESKILLPNGTQLNFKKVKGRGINFKFLDNQKLKIRNRQGGEFFKPDSKRPTKEIKQLLQESDLPPWDREFFPIIFVGGELVCVPNFGIDQKYQAEPQLTGLEIKLTQSK